MIHNDNFHKKLSRTTFGQKENVLNNNLQQKGVETNN